MRKSWRLVSLPLVAALVVLGGWLLAGCGGQATTTTQAPTTTVAQSTTSLSQATTTLPETTTLAETTTSGEESTTSTTVAVIIPSVASTKYEDKKLGFSVVRPKSTLVATQGFEGFLPLTQTPVVAFTLPEELFAGTNLGEAGVYVGASSSAEATSKWNVPVADSAETSVGMVEINGVTFAVFTSVEPAAGNIYEERVYRTLHAGICFEVVELLHSGNIANYPPSIKEFDRAKFEGYLEAMMRTFAFTTTG